MTIRLLSLVLLCPLLALAGEASLSLPGLPSYTKQHNPDLAAARLRITEAQGRLLGSGRFANPEAGVSFTHDRRFEEGTIGVSFDQKFPLTARLRLEKALSKQLVTAAELEVQDMERKLIAEVQALAVKLLSLEQQGLLRKEQTELAQKLSKFAVDRAAAGELSPLDAAQAQVDSQRLLLEGRKIETEKISLLGELKPKLGLAPTDRLSLKGTLPEMSLPAKSSWQQRADYQLSRIAEDAARTEIDLAKSRKWDDLTAGVILEGENHEDGVNGLESKPFFGFRLSLPLPFWNKNEGEIAEKTASSRRAALETKALSSLIANEAEAARDEMAAYASLARETKDKLLPLVTEQTGKLEKAYESGQTDLLTVLRAREQRLQLEAAVLEATRDYHLARVRYEAALGKHAPATTPGK
jgi:outer membrane protein, heavy metal efflux system